MSYLKRIVMVCAVAAVVSACGSSSSSGPSKATFLKSANAICTKHFDTITAGVSKLTAGGKLPNPASFGKFAMGTVIPQTAEQVAGLGALKAPSSLSGQYATWLTNLRAALAKMKGNPIVIRSSATFATVNHEAKGLGLSSNCDLGPGS